MLKNLKMYYIVVILMLAVSVCNAKQQNRYLLDLSNIEPNSFEKLDIAKRSEILSTIADQSYKILLDTTKTGLKDSNEPLKKIIETRKWLEKTNHITARTLALFMQWSVDSAVLNEMLRSEFKKTGKPLKRPFKENSVDSETIKSLLNENIIDEVEYLNFALTLDSNAANYCKKAGYGTKDILGTKVWASQEGYTKMVFWVTRAVLNDSNEVKAYEKVPLDVLTEDMIYVIVDTQIKTKKDLIEYFLPIVCDYVDSARDARLIGDIYIEYKGFTDSNLTDIPTFLDKIVSFKASEGKLDRIKEINKNWVNMHPHELDHEGIEFRNDYIRGLTNTAIRNFGRRVGDINKKETDYYYDIIRLHFLMFTRNKQTVGDTISRHNIKNSAGFLLELKD